MPKLSLAKLERHFYSAADRLRQEGMDTATFDAATYKDHIFGMLGIGGCRIRNINAKSQALPRVG
jgi:type I restriction enzyme M protein